MKNHTKGPYRVSGSRMARNGFENPMVETGYEDSSPLLAEILGQDRPWEEKLATAQLFAAAPFLLESLQVIASQYIGEDWTAEQALLFVKQHARQAIEKAFAI